MVQAQHMVHTYRCIFNKILIVENNVVSVLKVLKSFCNCLLCLLYLCHQQRGIDPWPVFRQNSSLPTKNYSTISSHLQSMHMSSLHFFNVKDTSQPKPLHLGLNSQ